MSYKMKGFSGFTSSPLKQEDNKKTREDAIKNRYFKPSHEVMHPPYKRPVGPTEKRHYVHKGSALDDNLDLEMRPRKEAWEIERDKNKKKK